MLEFTDDMLLYAFFDLGWFSLTQKMATRHTAIVACVRGNVLEVQATFALPIKIVRQSMRPRKKSREAMKEEQTLCEAA